MAKIAKRGVLLPLFSLWSRKYQGGYLDLAKYFLDWLSHNNFNVWQLLPVSATSWKVWPGQFDSPYSSYGIGLNPLFLPESLRAGPFDNASEEFLEKNQDWVYDYAIFSALSEKFDTDDWRRWPKKYQQVTTNNLESAHLSSNLAGRVQFFINQQSFLWIEFRKLRLYAQKCGVELWGDMPFYLPLRSPLVWKNQEAFLLHMGKMEFVAGSPGGKHFTKRQVWGFPLYRFETKKGTALAGDIWKLRIAYYSQLFDNCRLDAAVRFFEYEKISLLDPKQDSQKKGPGEVFFAGLVRVAREHGMNVYIEDISSLDMAGLQRARIKHKISGISVFSMILAPGEITIDPIDFDLGFSPDQIYFTASHDTMPMLRYLTSLSDDQKNVLASTFSIGLTTPEQMANDILKKLEEKTTVLIVAIQDLLASQERINIPGLFDNRNWSYRTEVPVEQLPKL